MRWCCTTCLLLILLCGCVSYRDIQSGTEAYYVAQERSAFAELQDAMTDAGATDAQMTLLERYQARMNKLASEYGASMLRVARQK